MSAPAIKRFSSTDDNKQPLKKVRVTDYRVPANRLLNPDYRFGDVPQMVLKQYLGIDKKADQCALATNSGDKCSRALLYESKDTKETLNCARYCFAHCEKLARDLLDYPKGAILKRGLSARDLLDYPTGAIVQHGFSATYKHVAVIGLRLDIGSLLSIKLDKDLDLIVRKRMTREDGSVGPMLIFNTKLEELPGLVCAAMKDNDWDGAFAVTLELDWDFAAEDSNKPMQLVKFTKAEPVLTEAEKKDQPHGVLARVLSEDDVSELLETKVLRPGNKWKMYGNVRTSLAFKNFVPVA